MRLSDSILFCLCYVRLVRPVFILRCECCVTWESLYIQEYHRKGYLITEQLKHEHNILFDHISTTLPTKYSDTALTAKDEHRPKKKNVKKSDTALTAKDEHRPNQTDIT